MSATPVNCEGCRHWNVHDEGTHLGGGETAGDDFASWGTCRRQHDPDLPTVMFSMDSSDYSSWIITRKDFSCSEWSAR